VALYGRGSTVAGGDRIKDGEVVACQCRRSREGALSGCSGDDLVGSAGIYVERNPALVVIDASGVDDALQHGPLGIRNLPVQYLQTPGLRVAAEPEDRADGSQIFRPGIGARQHYDRADPG